MSGKLGVFWFLGLARKIAPKNAIVEKNGTNVSGKCMPEVLLPENLGKAGNEMHKSAPNPKNGVPSVASALHELHCIRKVLPGRFCARNTPGIRVAIIFWSATVVVSVFREVRRPWTSKYPKERGVNFFTLFLAPHRPTPNQPTIAQQADSRSIFL